MVLVSVVQVSLFLLLVRCLFLSLLDLCCGGVFNLLVPPASASLSTFCLINSAPPGKISFRPSPSPSSLPPTPLPTVPSLLPSPPSRPLLNASPSFGINTFDQFPPPVKFPRPSPPSLLSGFIFRSNSHSLCGPWTIMGWSVWAGRSVKPCQAAPPPR